MCVLAVSAILPSWHVVWLVKPFIGIEVRPLQAEYLGLGSGVDLAVSVALGGIGIGAAAFYLDHCTIRQPLWAVVGGWGLLLGGFLTATLQEIVRPSQTTFIDIDHLVWPLGLVPASIGAAVILLSWWRAPEFFSPHLSRLALLGLVVAIAILGAFDRQWGPTTGLAVDAGIIVTTSLALIGASWITQRRSHREGGEETGLGLG